ncbi:MAG: phosphoenolpyruvate carboxykinase (ATP), partial [Candidatus Omnitrophica bacterium]|nr:phosphoenolpyruvate carboxykinase (ATP) [Candidatus Omnitrophota bacterium]
MEKETQMQVNLEKIGINDTPEIYYNVSYDGLFEHELHPEMKGLKKGVISKLGAVAVETGSFTGRSPKDKYIVEDDLTRDSIWWASGTAAGSDNKKLSPEAWQCLK